MITVRDEVLERGFAVGRGMLAGATLMNSSAWSSFVASWRRLVLDEYTPGSYGYRYRRLGCYVYSSRASRVSVRPHEPFRQETSAARRLYGALERHFAPIETGCVDSVLSEIIGIDASCIPTRALKRNGYEWRVNAHQIRVIGHVDRPGLPTPEGSHHDGHEFVAIHLIGRENTSGGVSYVHDVDGRELARTTLSDPFDSVFVDDRRVLHSVSEIVPLVPPTPAVRDVLVVTFDPASAREAC